MPLYTTLSQYCPQCRPIGMTEPHTSRYILETPVALQLHLVVVFFPFRCTLYGVGLQVTVIFLTESIGTEAVCVDIVRQTLNFTADLFLCGITLGVLFLRLLDQLKFVVQDAQH